MPGVPIGFPFVLDDEHLDGAIAEMLEAENWPGFDNFALLGPELKLVLLVSGLQEQQRRERAAFAARMSPVVYVLLAVCFGALVIVAISVLGSGNI